MAQAKIPSYNLALDLMCLAGKEAKKGNAVNAATLLIQASKDPSFKAALGMVEATNSFAIQAAAKKVKAKAPTKPAKAKKVKAEADDEVQFEETDEDTEAVLSRFRSAVKAEFPGDADGDGEIDGDDFEEVDEEEDEEAVEASTVKRQAAAFAKALARMKANSK